MGETKEISKKSHVWGHIGAITFDVLIGVLLIVLYFKEKIGRISRKMMVLILGIILVFFSLMSLVPILMDYDKIIIE